MHPEFNKKIVLINKKINNSFQKDIILDDYFEYEVSLRRYCPTFWLLGLTATASAFVLEDLKAEFGIGIENIKTLLSFSGPELKFYVYKDEIGYYELKKWLLIEILDRLNRER